MCEHGVTVDLAVPIPAHLSHSGRDEVKVKPIDSCIAPIVSALIDGGVPTIGSCCGHGKDDGSILLLDGRNLTITERAS